MLKTIQSKIGSGITDGEQLSRIAKKLFGKRFKGIYPIKTTRDVPPLKEGDIAILNRNMHWFGAFRKGGKLYESDSYGIDELGRGYIDKKPAGSFLQPSTTTDCGSRLLVNLFFALNK